jgi:predicted dehydrogenase
MEKINLGFVGYGYWGPNLVRNFYATDGANVSMVCDLNLQRLELVKTIYPSVKVTQNYEELVKDSSIDAIVISTQVSSHFSLAKKALEAGKHVFLEKPMTATVKEAEELVNIAERKKKVLMVDHIFLYTGAVRKIKKVIEDEELGNIYYFDSVRVNLGLFQHDVNVIWDLATHDLSIMDYLLAKKPEVVSAVGIAHFGNLENIAYITVQFPDNLLAHIHVNWLAPVKIRTTLIGGSKKMVVYDDNEPSEKVKIYDCGVTCTEKKEDVYQMLVQYRTGDMLAPKLDTTEALKLMSKEFIDSINQNRKPFTDGEAGLRVTRLLEAANESLKEKGRVVKV